MIDKYILQLSNLTYYYHPFLQEVIASSNWEDCKQLFEESQEYRYYCLLPSPSLKKTGLSFISKNLFSFFIPSAYCPVDFSFIDQLGKRVWLRRFLKNMSHTYKKGPKRRNTSMRRKRYLYHKQVWVSSFHITADCFLVLFRSSSWLVKLIWSVLLWLGLVSTFILLIYSFAWSFIFDKRRRSRVACRRNLITPREKKKQKGKFKTIIHLNALSLEINIIFYLTALSLEINITLVMVWKSSMLYRWECTRIWVWKLLP